MNGEQIDSFRIIITITLIVCFLSFIDTINSFYIIVTSSHRKENENFTTVSYTRIVYIYSNI